MKQILFLLCLLLAACTVAEPTVQWLDWSTWNEKAKLADKKGIVYIHSPTCDECIVMGKEAFGNPEVIKFMAEHYYAIKLDVHEQSTIQTKGRAWTVKTNRDGSTYHELAAALCNSEDNITYPTVAFLNEQFDLIVPIPQKLSAEDLLLLLRFVATDSFKQMTIEEFRVSDDG